MTETDGKCREDTYNCSEASPGRGSSYSQYIARRGIEGTVISMVLWWVYNIIAVGTVHMETRMDMYMCALNSKTQT